MEERIKQLEYNSKETQYKFSDKNQLSNELIRELADVKADFEDYR